MKVTVKTLTFTLQDREVELTRAIVKQLPYLRDAQYQRGELKVIGDVSFPNEVIYIWQTPDGLCQSRFTPHIEFTENGKGYIQRIILTK